MEVGTILGRVWPEAQTSQESLSQESQTLGTASPAPPSSIVPPASPASSMPPASSTAEQPDRTNPPRKRRTQNNRC